jgi:peptidoglycan glycosyltransferase
MERRIRWLGIVMALFFVALFVQLNNIQILKAHALSTSPNNPRVIQVNRNDPRGDILSADGIVLASSVPSTKGYYKYQRVYNPLTATLFSQIVGYDTIFGTRTGVESVYNQFLQSHTRPAKTLSDLLTTRTTTGNVYLTISASLQLKVANIVTGINKNGSAPQAGAVVFNVKTGAIEAMYGQPTYDPIPLTSEDPKAVTAYYNSLDPGNGANSPLVSQAYQHGSLPGSTFKVVTSSAVYDHQPALAKVNYPSPVTNTSPPISGCISVPQTPLPLCNYHHEPCSGTIQQTLPASCNTAFAQMGMSLKTSLNTEAESFGFNKQVPLDLTDVGVSNFPTAAELVNNAPLQAYSAFGQGTAVSTDIATTLQMALVAGGIANRGVIMTPHVMQQIRDSQGNLVETYKPTPWLTATNPLTAAAVTSLMQAVVTSGTAKGVFPALENVAAKTGTAETSGAFGQPLTNDWMIAFAPANDPRVAVAVSVPNQVPSSTGAEISGPPTAAILSAALAATP